MLQQLPARLRRAIGSAKDGAFIAQVIHKSGMVSGLGAKGTVAFVQSLIDSGMGPHLAVMLHAIGRPHRAAVVCGARRMNYTEFDKEANRLGHALASLGAASGEKVALMLPNCIEHLVAQECLPRIGNTSVQIGYRLKAAEIVHILDNAEPQVVIYHKEYESELRGAITKAGGPDESQLIVVGSAPGETIYGHRYEELLAEQRSDSPPRKAGGGGVIVYTSGTTGKPKGATRNWRDTGIAAVADLWSQVEARHDEKHLVVCPLYHSGALAFAKMTSVLGGTTVILEHFDAEEALAAIATERITSMFMVPTMLSRLCALEPEVRAKYDTSSLRWVVSGAAPLPTALAGRFQEYFGPVLWNFYGATETGLVTLAGPGDHTTRPGTVGRPLRGNQIRILDDEGDDASRGEVGELYVKNSMIITGYHKNDDATRKSTRAGFFSVGDLARTDDDGYVYLASRKSDMVISGGVNIYPREIEDVLHQHPDVIEAAVIGVPDEEWGEVLKAFVVTRPGSSLGEEGVVSFCREHLASFKRPRHVTFVDELPRNPTGKVLKRELRG